LLPVAVVEVVTVPSDGRLADSTEEAPSRSWRDDLADTGGRWRLDDADGVGASRGAADVDGRVPCERVAVLEERRASLERGAEAIGRLRPGVAVVVLEVGDQVAAVGMEPQRVAVVLEATLEVSDDAVHRQVVAVHDQHVVPCDNQKPPGRDYRARGEDMGDSAVKEPPADVGVVLPEVVELDELRRTRVVTGVVVDLVDADLDALRTQRVVSRAREQQHDEKEAGDLTDNRQRKE